MASDAWELANEARVFSLEGWPGCLETCSKDRSLERPGTGYVGPGHKLAQAEEEAGRQAVWMSSQGQWGAICLFLLIRVTLAGFL